VVDEAKRLALIRSIDSDDWGTSKPAAKAKKKNSSFPTILKELAGAIRGFSSAVKDLAVLSGKMIAPSQSKEGFPELKELIAQLKLERERPREGTPNHRERGGCPSSRARVGNKGVRGD
jgi:hypothetical protein